MNISTVYSCCLYVLLIFAFFIFLNTSSYSQIAPGSCEIVQLTDTSENSSRPRVCGNGGGVLFQSNADILNNGHADQQDLFFADISDPFSPVFYQITNTAQTKFLYSISDDCGAISLTSASDFLGTNMSNNQQIFRIDISNPASPVFTQVTNTTSGFHRSIISGDGTKIAFSTQADITGMNPDGSVEYYVFDSENLVLPISQITNDPANNSSSSQDPVINQDGRKVAFVSSENFVPPNVGATGVRDIYLSMLSYNPPNLVASSLQQVSNFPFQEFNAQDLDISPQGNSILYTSQSNIVGLNPDRNLELFLYDIPSNEFFQVTTSNMPTPTVPTGFLNSDGTMAIFRTSNPDFNPFGQNSEQIILSDISDPNNPTHASLSTFGQGELLGGISVTNDLSLVTFISESDVAGNNEDGSREIFLLLAGTCQIISVPTLSEWGLIFIALILGISGCYAVFRNKVAS
ncbi:MAG: IPTL-CTERM sorting domain-containing protein [Thermodesulfobacteriota bacterium]